MSRIRLLSEKVANQIAAGEVIERPASIVKELVENAIDASATRIRIEIEAGGRALIRVTDNGIGMSRDDALLSLERHATSKITHAKDLSSIRTMGFRGEALPSISSVSRFTLTTKERSGGDAEGTKITVCGGRLIDVCAASGAIGTTIEVRNVFFNLPARRKFLRTSETERAHIAHYLQLVALAHPKIGFAYIQEGRSLWQVPPISDSSISDSSDSSNYDLSLLIQRFKELQQDVSQMLSINEKDVFEIQDSSNSRSSRSSNSNSSNSNSDSSDSSNSDSRSDSDSYDLGEEISLWGLIGAPGISRSNRSDQHLFVNRRPVENRGLNRALIEGYHTSLMRGRFPRCCLFLEISPHLVDVNVHPAKREVRFRNEFEVRRFVSETIKKRLRSNSSKSPRRHFSKSEDEFEKIENEKDESEKCESEFEDEKFEDDHDHNLHSELSNSDSNFDSRDSLSLIRSRSIEKKCVSERRLLEVPLRWVGVIHRLYVVYESDRGMVLMDQHAAHERILFERMMRQMEEGGVPSQCLLIAETLELSPRDSQFLKGQLSALLRLGVGISEFGEHTFLLDALPPFIKVSDAKQFTIEVIDQLMSSGESIGKLRLGEEVIAKTVCRNAVKANDLLHPSEFEKLLDDLRKCELPYTCPHGRPTLIEFSHQELEKHFGRIQ